MKLNLLHYMTGAFVVLMLNACYKDLGNYDYEDPNKVIFGGINDRYSAMQGSYFEIIPQLNFTDPAAADSARYKYEWIGMKIGALFADKRKDLGNNKGLRFKVNLTAGRYTIYYRVLDTLTGIQWQKSFELEVTSNIYEGWMLMTEVNGKARLDMINKLNNQYTVLPDVLTSTGSGLSCRVSRWLSIVSGCRRQPTVMRYFWARIKQRKGSMRKPFSIKVP
ncbi:PKD-like family lipoprotein [Paraflavitalea speifideaquila]|uniref:PKD-like family lipoprotein n=1 Tax=Paraflavitalea speifideaquila TaxID=3076558 RepID=UPI0028E934C6|nr:PKD-like family lipoprotein [Paraflavitalea speifideiaquila]